MSSDVPVTPAVVGVYPDGSSSSSVSTSLAADGARAAMQSLTQTSAVQTVLKLTGYWTEPIDGAWTPELTDALNQFQTALGVPPSGSVDAATLAAFGQALANLKTAATTTTTGAPPATRASTPTITTTTTSTAGSTSTP